MSQRKQPGIISYFYVFLTHYACSVSMKEGVYLAMINVLVRNRCKARKCSDSRHHSAYYSDQQFRIQKFIIRFMIYFQYTGCSLFAWWAHVRGAQST